KSEKKKEKTSEEKKKKSTRRSASPLGSKTQRLQGVPAGGHHPWVSTAQTRHRRRGQQSRFNGMGQGRQWIQPSPKSRWCEARSSPIDVDLKAVDVQHSCLGEMRKNHRSGREGCGRVPRARAFSLGDWVRGGQQATTSETLTARALFVGSVELLCLPPVRCTSSWCKLARVAVPSGEGYLEISVPGIGRVCPPPYVCTFGTRISGRQVLRLQKPALPASGRGFTLGRL
ncbi:hypothetical protein MAPG_01495, partial [Magnaporthiopsis poae ATCC 64411]|uniref:Uncharacterized protein n=1 Tax=Magnaporthiopsis poae (strain ATCC 64411 / 73-15) TaxID=644358 RepID=A0A0C4DNU8_MAGP6